MHRRCCRPPAGTLTGIINEPLLLHLDRCLYYLYQWCTVKQISDNEIYLLNKYIKSVLWRVAKRLSYIQDARCLKVNRHIQLFQRNLLPPSSATLKNESVCSPKILTPLYQSTGRKNLSPLSLRHCLLFYSCALVVMSLQYILHIMHPWRLRHLYCDKMT